MIVSGVNIVICGVAFVLGIYTFIRHLSAFNKGNTPVVDAWLVCVGTMAWSVWLLDSVQAAIEQGTIQHQVIGVSGAEVFGNVLLFVYWAGTLLQVQKHCIRLKIRQRQIQKRKGVKYESSI